MDIPGELGWRSGHFEIGECAPKEVFNAVNQVVEMFRQACINSMGVQTLVYSQRHFLPDDEPPFLLQDGDISPSKELNDGVKLLTDRVDQWRQTAGKSPVRTIQVIQAPAGHVVIAPHHDSWPVEQLFFDEDNRSVSKLMVWPHPYPTEWDHQLELETADHLLAMNQDGWHPIQGDGRLHTLAPLTPHYVRFDASGIRVRVAFTEEDPK